MQRDKPMADIPAKIPAQDQVQTTKAMQCDEPLASFGLFPSRLDIQFQFLCSNFRSSSVFLGNSLLYLVVSLLLILLLRGSRRRRA